MLALILWQTLGWQYGVGELVTEAVIVLLLLPGGPKLRRYRALARVIADRCTGSLRVVPS